MVAAESEIHKIQTILTISVILFWSYSHMAS